MSEHALAYQLRKLTTGGPGVTHIASETLFSDAADEIDRLEFAITRWKKYETETEAEHDRLLNIIGHAEALLKTEHYAEALAVLAVAGASAARSGGLP